jgi:2-aminoadipate transaminase
MLSQRAIRTEAPPISWLMQQAVEVPGLVSLAAGLVDRASLPLERVQRLVAEILGDPELGRDALQYGTTPGCQGLRELVSKRYVAGTAYEDPARVVVSAGSQQSLELLGEAIYDPGDLVIVEDPTYFVYTGVLRSFGVHIRGVPSDEDGMRMDRLAALLDELEQRGQLGRLKAIYVVSYHQNPSGSTLSHERREQLMRLVRELPESVLLIEDAAYYELAFDVETRPPLLASMDPSGERVATMLTASKPCAPGLKTGFAILPTRLVEPVVHLKGNHDFGSNNFAHFIIARALASGVFDQQVEDLRVVYRRKATLLSEALTAALPAGAASWSESTGGLYLWPCLPGLITDPDSPFFRACLDQRVLYVPGSYAYAPEHGVHKPRDRLRLTYGVASDDDLVEGATRFAAAYRAVGG